MLAIGESTLRKAITEARALINELFVSSADLAPDAVKRPGAIHAEILCGNPLGN